MKVSTRISSGVRDRKGRRVLFRASCSDSARDHDDDEDDDGEKKRRFQRIVEKISLVAFFPDREDPADDLCDLVDQFHHLYLRAVEDSENLGREVLFFVVGASNFLRCKIKGKQKIIP